VRLWRGRLGIGLGDDGVRQVYVVCFRGFVGEGGGVVGAGSAYAYEYHFWFTTRCQRQPPFATLGTKLPCQPGHCKVPAVYLIIPTGWCGNRL
jgi:hypothetical protein